MIISFSVFKKNKCSDFFTSEISPEILMNVLKGCIISLNWVNWVLFSFHLKQKKVFSLDYYWKWLLYVLTCRILSRYSEINNFKIRKDLFFKKDQKLQKHTKDFRFQRKLQFNEVAKHANLLPFKGK